MPRPQRRYGEMRERRDHTEIHGYIAGRANIVENLVDDIPKRIISGQQDYQRKQRKEEKRAEEAAKCLAKKRRKRARKAHASVSAAA